MVVGFVASEVVALGTAVEVGRAGERSLVYPLDVVEGLPHMVL